MQPGRTAGLQTLGQRQAGAVVAPARDGEVGEDNHVIALHRFVEVDGRPGGDLCHACVSTRCIFFDRSCEHTVREKQHISLHCTRAVVIHSKAALSRWLRAWGCLAIDKLCCMKQSGKRGSLHLGIKSDSVVQFRSIEQKYRTYVNNKINASRWLAYHILLLCQAPRGVKVPHIERHLEIR